MAGVLRYWRESASLILASKRLPPFQPAQTLLNKVMGKTPEAISGDQEEALRFLLMKRSSSSRFMPDTYVFPGGMLDDSDFSKNWTDYLQLTNESHHFFTKAETGSSIFSRQRDNKFSQVSGEVALRLAAIRETFEESGILIARPKSERKSVNLVSEDNHPLGCSVHDIQDKKVMAEWREKISNDSGQFLTMCREMEVVPDIWSLYEWSNWMTPLLLRSSRFDTAFFVGCVDEAPQISVNTEEMDTGQWVSPSSMLQASLNKLVTLAPPQIYELSRLIRFASVDDLLVFAWKRSEQRVDRWMPVISKCADGIVFSLPGDDLYPDDPDVTGERTTEFIQRPEKFAELQETSPYQHRAFISDSDKTISVFCNLEFTHGHILPLNLDKLKMSKSNSWT